MLFKFQFVGLRPNAECRMQKAELWKSFAFGKTQNVFSHQRKDFIHCSLFIVHSAFAVYRAKLDKLQFHVFPKSSSQKERVKSSFAWKSMAAE